MKQKKPVGYSINALSERFKVDRRTLKKYLSGTKPLPGGGYALSDVESVLSSLKKDKALSSDLKGEKLLEEIRKLRLRNDREESKLVERAKVAETVRRIYGALRQQIEQKLCNEYPTAVAGLAPEQARIYGKRIFDQIMAAHLEIGKEWE